MNHPAVYWRAFAEHCAICPPCKQVGGTAAPADALCPIGAALVDAWDAAELSWTAMRLYRVLGGTTRTL